MRLGQRVETLSRRDDGYLVSAGDERYTAEHVVVATGPFHHPRVPGFAAQLDPAVTQLHSRAYRNPGQLPQGDVLVVGAGNSGAEIAAELAASRKTYLSGRDTGHIPIGVVHNRLSLWVADHVLTVDTRLGRRMRAAGRRGDPVLRLHAKDIAAAGVERVSRVEGITDGRPRLADGQILDVAVVVWATGFRPDLGWIELPIFDNDGYPIHHRGVVAAAPGLYFIGLPFQHSPTSTHIGGVGKDARNVAEHLAALAGGPRRRPARAASSASQQAPAETAGRLPTACLGT